MIYLSDGIDFSLRVAEMQHMAIMTFRKLPVISQAETREAMSESQGVHGFALHDHSAT